MKKFKKLISSIFIMFVTAIALGTINSANAASAGPMYLGIVSLRNSGYGYQQSGGKVWKIAEYDSTSDVTADLNKTIYCIKGGPGFGSSDLATGGVPAISRYSQKFNLKDLSSIDSTYKAILPTGTNYNSLMWLLDNIYIMPKVGVDNTTNREAFLKSKITDEYLYELVTDDDIDVVQQLAIWYFTNPDASDTYHYLTTNLTVNSIKNVDDNYVAISQLPQYEGLDDEPNGWDREDAIEALFQYYITNAQANSNYVSPNNTTTPIEVVKDNATMQKIGNNYVAGPYKINKILDVDYEITASYTDIEGNTITPTLGVKDTSGNIVATAKTIKELVGTDFYLMMPTSSNISGIKMTINSSYTSRTAEYWSVENAPSTEQPVVIVDETPHNFSETVSLVVPKPFDLSLRKFITDINGTSITSRIPTVDVSKLASGEDTTAIYNHPKTPVKVAIGDTVTYTIRVYNEGEIDGYVEEITDHLPEQLEFIVDDQTNIDYGWRIASSSDLKTVKTEFLAKANETADGANKIAAFNGNTLSYKDVKIKCKVVATEPMPNKITNIADITKFTDGNRNTVTDRDSQANNVNLPIGTDLENYRDAEINRGEEYIAGQQDDDDFEKLTLKSFDLSLRKFITKANNIDITNRVPGVDVSPLNNNGTTATYKHPKTPVSVAIGDIVEYTIRVYNEAEIDGYAEEITDHLPDQLEFIADDVTNQEYGWTVDSGNSKIIRTDYLSKAKETSVGANKIAAFNGTTLDYKEVKVVCKVVSTDPMPTKITNIADISKFTDGNGNTVTDRDSQENNVQIPSDLPGYKDDEIGKEYVPGQQDDDDFEKLKIKEFDLALRKFITKVNDEEITNRKPTVDVSKLVAGTATTATYKHPKTPVSIEIGDIVEYTIRVYDEAEVDGYAEEIADHLPEQLEFIADNATNQEYGWTVDSGNSKIIRTDYLSKAKETSVGANKIAAFNGTTLDYKEVKVVCKVVSTDPMPTKITNIADISKFTDGNGNTVTDRDSQEDNVQMPSDLPGYKDSEIGKEYVPGQQDDDDFEKLILKEFDLALRKFITKVNDTEIKSRIPQVDITPLKNGTGTTAIYNHSKEPVKVSVGSVVEYTIRVYNEGQIDGYAEMITDHLPDQLEFISDNDTNKKYGWVLDSENSKIIRTDYLSKAKEISAGANKIAAFDGTTLSYKEVKVACKVVSTKPMPTKITNIADVSDFTDGNGNTVTDRDSQENNVQIPEDLPGYKDSEIEKEYVPGQQDDDDFEKVAIVKFDLSLRKFITAVNNTAITSRAPQVDVSGLVDGTSTTATYTHPKDPVLVSNGNVVTYTIRVYNEGEMDGYAQKVKDDIPEGLKFLKEHDTNKEYRWVMIDKDGKETDNEDEAVSIVTDYLSKEQEKTAGANLIKAFNAETKELSYKDVKVAFEVTEPNTSDRIVINKAQISEDSDKDGNDVDDQDSTPDEWNEGEDDQDIEKVKVQYFDLSLRKWVTQAIVTENGEDRIIETGHTAEDDPEDVVKVDLKKSKINKVTVKFRYKIRVKNEGNIAGYAKEVKDYIPQGLKFVAEDNPLWTQIDENTIVTDQTKDILLQPGDTTELEVILTWINDSENFGVMDNWAEISKDDNDFDSPDIDSTPNNNKHGEDDIDDAPVLLSVQTGQVAVYTTITMAVLAILTSGVVLIKKFVL